MSSSAKFSRHTGVRSITVAARKRFAFGISRPRILIGAVLICAAAQAQQFAPVTSKMLRSPIRPIG